MTILIIDVSRRHNFYMGKMNDEIRQELLDVTEGLPLLLQQSGSN
jgi:hypothetical protein